MEEKAKTFERNVQDAYDDIDKSHLRKIRKGMHECAAKCCEDTVNSYEGVQRCVELCSGRLQKSQNYLKTEFEDFQYRIQRCFLVCKDNISEKMDKDKVKEVNEKYRHEYEECGTACLDKHIGLLPAVVSKIRTSLESNM